MERLRIAVVFNLVALTFTSAAGADPIHDGLVSWWKMNEPSWSGVAGEVLDSQSENHCTAVGDATTAVGTISRAGDFDANSGVDDYVSCGTGIQVSNEYTFEAWVYLDGEQRSGFWQRGDTSPTGSFQIEFYVPEGYQRPIVIHDRTGSMNYRQFNAHSIPTDEWAHVALTWEKPDWKLYVNGQPVGTYATSGTPENPPVGLETHVGRARGAPANAKLDEVRIYDRALTEDEVLHNYNYERGLLAWWKMDEPGWSGVTDEVVDSDGVSDCTAVDGATTDAAAYLGRSGGFDPSVDLQYVSCGGDIQVSSAYTFEAWAYLESGQHFGFWQRGGATWPLGIFQIEFYVPEGTYRRPIIVHNRTYGMNYRQFDGDSIPTDEWVHVVLTWEDLDWKLYVNGQEVGAYATYGTPADPPVGQMNYVGLGSKYAGASGNLDEVRIYDRALTRQEVWERYEVSDIARRPRVARVGTNLMPDPSSEAPEPSPNEWVYANGAERSDALARTGSWAIRLPVAPVPKARAKSPATLVTPGMLYTASFYVQSTQWPTPTVFVQVLEYRDGAGPPCSDSFPTKAKLRSHAPADNDLWNEVVAFYTAGDAVTCIRVQVQRMDKPLEYPAGDIWLDDFYVGEQVGFEQEPGRKRSFAGSRVRVDALGNMEVLTGTLWRPFFPRMIYPDLFKHSLWAEYAPYGLNMVNKANTVADVQDATDNGLLASFSLDGFIVAAGDPDAGPPAPPGVPDATPPVPPHPDYGRTDHLKEDIDALADAGLLDRVALYNWDNEDNFEAWDNAQSIISSLRTFDPSALVYALNTHAGLARMYNNPYHVNIHDLAGSYVRDDVDIVGGVRDGLPEDLFTQDRLEDQRSPSWLAQLNNLDSASNPAGALRTRVYKALVLGSRGFCIYADCRPADCSVVPQANTTLWWPELPSIGNEIEGTDTSKPLIPLIREPHWTKWTLTVDASPDTIVWGTRYHHGYGYIILANMNLDSTSGDVTVTLSGADPGYTPTEIVDYFTGSVVATAVGDTFTVTIPPAGTAVYKFEP